jgi:hypothetical protein
MNLSDAEILELNALCSAVVDQTIDSAGKARLNAWLAASAEARRFYVRCMALSASLHDYAGELQSEEPDRVVRVPAWRWVAGALAAAAVVVLALWLDGAQTRRETPVLASGGDDETFVATLSATNECRWSGDGPALGDELRQGRQLQLVTGLAELTFNSGAQLVLEGPATLDVASAWAAVLRQGSLRANVPPEAVGFRVSNPDVEVTDLGTEFSMVANAQGGTEVFVLKGSVEASAEGRAQPITLREQQARRFDRASITEVRDREQKLKRWANKSKLVQFTRPADYVHWAFDEAEGTTLHAEAIGLTAGAKLDGRIAGAARVAGYRERALAFDGQTVASVEAPAVAKGGSTVAFWVQVPEDAGLTEAGPMLALQDGAELEISWNRDPTQGAIGALRTATERGHFIGATSLRDGRWHHVAVVFMPAGRVRQYVDGRLETVTAKKLKRRHGERFARNGSTIFLGGSDERNGRFRGMLDELFFATRALTPPEIRQLLRENRPAPAPAATIAEVGLKEF